MCSHLPLDDRLNQLFYTDGQLYRLVYDRVQDRCVMRRELRNITFDHVVALIGTGALLWSPPERFEELDTETSANAVVQEHALLCAFLLSPAARRITHAETRERLMNRLIDDDVWLTRRATGQP